MASWCTRGNDRRGCDRHGERGEDSDRRRNGTTISAELAAALPCPADEAIRRSGAIGEMIESGAKVAFEIIHGRPPPSAVGVNRQAHARRSTSRSRPESATAPRPWLREGPRNSEERAPHAGAPEADPMRQQAPPRP